MHLGVRFFHSLWAAFLRLLRPGAATEGAAGAPQHAESLPGSSRPAERIPAVHTPYRIAQPRWLEQLHGLDPTPTPDSTPEWAPVGDVIDLHTFHPKDIPSVVQEFLWAAREQGIEHVRIIHGKGKGVQRQRVQKILASHPEVVYFKDAPPEAGGWGATLAQLRPK